MLLATSSAMAETAVDTIMNVRTTQAFTDEAVSSEDLTTILQAGLAAASAINQQPWYFAAVTNRELMVSRCSLLSSCLLYITETVTVKSMKRSGWYPNI